MTVVEIAHRDPGEYRKWARRLGDADLRRVANKLRLLAEAGGALTMPHVRRMGGDLCELRADKHRLYFVIVDDTATFLAYGEKDTQQRDISRARRRKP